MFYNFPLTLTLGTAEASLEEEEAKLTHGVIHRLEIEFPAGCSGLAHLRILHLDHQLWPTNPGGNFASDNHVIIIDDYYQLYDGPYTLKLQGWNEDETYDHTVTVRIGILPQAVAEHIYGKLTRTELKTLREAFGLPAEGLAVPPPQILKGKG